MNTLGETMFNAQMTRIGVALHRRSAALVSDDQVLVCEEDGRLVAQAPASIAGLAEVLGGMLTGMRLSIEQSGIVLADTKVGHFVMAIDPTTFVPGAIFAERHASYLDGFKAQPGTMPAGGPEWARRADREAKGIPLPQGLHDELSAAGEKAQVPFPL